MTTWFARNLDLLQQFRVIWYVKLFILVKYQDPFAEIYRMLVYYALGSLSLDLKAVELWATFRYRTYDGLSNTVDTLTFHLCSFSELSLAIQLERR